MSEGNDNPQDPRPEFFGNYIIKALKVKSEKWFRLMVTEEQGTKVYNFLDNPECIVLIIFQNMAAQLFAMDSFPVPLKTKAIYFVKIAKVVVPKDNPSSVLIIGDMASKPIEQLATIVDDIFVPLLANPENHKNWATVVSLDVKEHVHSLKSTVYQVKGQINGQTILPMPVGVERLDSIEQIVKESDGKIVDLHFKSAVEGVIIKWATQITEVLSADSVSAFKCNQHLTPWAEVAFWNNRVQNLEYIFEQLRDQRIVKMTTIVQLTNSAYYPCLKNIYANVVSALEEANDIIRYLKPLQKHFKLLEETDFGDIAVCLSPLMHVVCLVWSNSRFYCSSGKIIVLLKQICNLLITQAVRYLDPTSIFQSDIHETKLRVRHCIFIFEKFRNIFNDYRKKLPSYFENEETALLWTFHPNIIFNRTDLFIRRLQIIEWFFDTVVEFTKLERIEFSGLKGRLLSGRITEIYADFNEQFSLFSSKAYDVLEPEDERFEVDYEQFKESIKDLDHRLAFTLSQAFEDSYNLDGVFKLIEIVGVVMDRSGMKDMFTSSYGKILNMLSNEVTICKNLFESQQSAIRTQGSANVDKLMPPIAGSLKWSKTLKARVEHPIQCFKNLDHPIVHSKKAQSIIKEVDEMIVSLNKLETDLIDNWKVTVSKRCEELLKLPLFDRRSKCNELQLNFHPELVAILREVHYFRSYELNDIPIEALQFHEREDTFRIYCINLNNTKECYNKLRNNSREIEFQLVQEEIQQIDELVKKGEYSLNWNSEGLNEYIGSVQDLVYKLYRRVQKTQENIKRMRSAISSWARLPVLCRKDNKKDTLLAMDDRVDRFSKRRKEIEKAATEIHKLLKENCVLFGMQDQTNVKQWQNYMAFVDSIVADALLNAIGCSLCYIAENMIPGVSNAPLFEACLELHEPDLVFTPSLDSNTEGNFCSIIQGIIEEIIELSKLMPRICDKKNARDYFEEMNSNTDICDMKEDIMNTVTRVIGEANDYCVNFENYSYLWLDDRELYMQHFLRYGHPLSIEEYENMSLDDTYSPPVVNPTMDQFKEQIDNFESLYCEIEQLKSVQVFDSWFQVDMRPFKQALLNTVCKWSHMFKQHLMDTVTNSLFDLAKFIQDADGGLMQPVIEGDYEVLVSVMGYLYNVKERQSTTDEMFQPLTDTIQLLKYYDMELSEEVNVLLQELPELWNNTCKLAINIKQQVAPLQAIEVNNIRNRISHFDSRINFFREIFKKANIFRYDCPFPYFVLNDANSKIIDFEMNMAQIQESASLFEVNVPEFKLLKQCRKELKLLKQLWDYVHLVHSCINDWKTTPWRKVDVENMDIECKKFAKEIRALDKEMRSWDTYTCLEATVKNMVTSLRAVGELQNPAIRERHWKQLMGSTKTLADLPEAYDVKFVMDQGTTLAELLALNLHECEDDVKTIVDKAVKEMSMEKMLRELQTTWAAMEFYQETHSRTGCSLLRASEKLIETLEENQVQLQNLMTSKFVAFFLEEVSSWQQKLSIADQVINSWFEVQRTWMHLESIFMSSDDIRKQLPEDSERFFRIDSEFKELMANMSKTPIVIEATNKPGLIKHLDDLHGHLTLCEKALAEYLETKRLAFPRFYFVSAADLLDILSNGNNPDLVVRHMIKLFDSIASLEFIGSKTTEKKVAAGMHAKDGEYVKFNEDCDCSGPVEKWLNKIQAMMRETIRHNFLESTLSYEEKPREQWLFDYPAQVSLCGTQIWWTTEVNIAFARLEEGYENALKDYQRKQISQLNTLISLLLGELTRQDRQKIMTICTIDVHSRDVVARLIQSKIENVLAFQWQSQLRHRWDEKEKDCFANICDAQFRYSHEYLGNTPRLVITPLTDRCYITLTQSLHLVMGGGPAGPAGTGKTETTKDLGRALGVMVYVFNCSEQMDYKSCGNIYKGLAQTGAWGCFDEFNRISVEVLSVVAVQVKSIQDAIREKAMTFNFMGEKISLIPSVGIFITMNPGYAGRTELPENLKALFRPCAMVVPDFELICEIMLVAEGFQEAKILARKFITLYTLCKELLSKQDHYDWGLRAIKSVLVVAGSLKRGDPGRVEEEVLMRALRDFNIPKIISDDVPVFMGLIGDLFPSLDVPRKRDQDFEKTVKQAAVDLLLQPEENFILKVVQLEELLEVRHSVFVVGNAGTGKTEVWKTLFRTYQNIKRKPIYNDLNPKAVTNDELFGVINPATREWKDGLFSVIMREQANIPNSFPKWILLDGDIDPMWIESLNTVMDDNKVLTLASNERIALTPSMRLIFEISNLRTATPATVSRAGILYLNPQDLGWNPYVTSWIETREHAVEKSNLVILFDKYIPPCLENIRNRFKKIIPITEMSHIQMLCHLLECILVPANTPTDCPKEWYELYFTFVCIWSFGAAIYQEQVVDYKVEFSKWWVAEFKTIKYPSQGTVFDYYIDTETKEFLPWTHVIPKFELDSDMPLQSALVHTPESIRTRFFVDLLMDHKHPVMLVGSAGCGKTVLMNEKLASLSENYAVTNIPFNYYTTSEMLQKILEKPLEKKAGRNYGPPGNKTLIYFLDDMNMPEVDCYGTVQPHTLIRQHLDYGHWYDRTKLSLKDIHNCQYVSCMNPTAGSFTINPRLQRHFCVIAVSFPGSESLTMIYASILNQHFGNFEYRIPQAASKLADNVIEATIWLHNKVNSVFLPTATKFHYIFNLRDLSNVFQGLLFSTGECLNCSADLMRLWMHECQRVYSDKLVDDKDSDAFTKIQTDALKKFFDEIDECAVFEKPNIYCHFAQGIGEPKYSSVRNWTNLTKLLEEALNLYNDLVAAMNLVLFEDAMMHICRINRILESPRGSCLLVGVGGSGKQCLARLAAFISSLEVAQIQLRKGYGLLDLKMELSSLYLKSGLKNVGIVFLMTDAQVPSESFLVLINDMLSTGEIPELFPDDEVENIIAGVRNEVKGAGQLDTRENCWKFFIDRVRRQLKVVLCFSPVGSVLRVRSRKFPALVNCTSINWFHEWPQQALMSVSNQFLSELEVLPENFRESVAKFMGYAHTQVNIISRIYLQSDRRYNYTTPKSFLEQISLYSKLLRRKSAELASKIDRLENGLEKLKSTANQVDNLKEKLAIQEVELKIKNDAADKLIQIVGIETEKVSKEKAFADDEEKKVGSIAEEVKKKQRDCEEDLVKAEPALLAAQEALNTLNKSNLTELKSFGSPPGVVTNVTAAVMVLLAQNGKIPKDRSWKATKIMMAKVDSFLDLLINYDKENIHPEVTKAIKPYLKDPEFEPEFVRSKSAAAAGLCAWVINIIKFYEVYCDVEPKRLALAQANLELAQAQEKLAVIKKKVASLEEQLSKLTADFEQATSEKLHCQQEADATNKTIELANRLIGGLGSENVRWAEAVACFMQQSTTLPGDVLLITAFISYVGCFTKHYRQELLHKIWTPFVKTLDPAVPITEGLDPLTLLTDDTQVAIWNNEGLPSDRMSTENATILSNSDRWPLMIDPQLQGVKWIKQKYGESLVVLRLGQKGSMEELEKSITTGRIVLLENIEENLDPVLDPLLGRNLIKKGKAIKMGDKEVEYNQEFRLLLHTKLANPHYKPEMQAQTTLINFTVTRDGLEDQLLAEVVKAERPDLEQLKAELTKQQNDFKIMLKKLEDDLLSRLSSAGDNILSDTALVENLETTKRTAAEIQQKVAEAKITSEKIDEAREHYRPAAARASLLYFILNELNTINLVYQFSLKAFSVVFNNAIEKSVPAETVSLRVNNLIDCITYFVFVYTSRGLFECDKLIFASQMTFQILLMSEEIAPQELDFFLRFPTAQHISSPVEFLSNSSWSGVRSLSTKDEFRNLDRDIETSSKRWKKFVESDCPEREKFPQEWKNKVSLQRLMMMRALRPDRMTYAMSVFIEEKLGSKYVEGRSVEFAKSFEETSPTTPIFFILSPGVNPLKDVEDLGHKLGISTGLNNFHNVSLGQGQEVVAESAMEISAQNGHWVVLQNIHLVKKWLPTLEKKMELLGDTAHPSYRLFLSAEPAATASAHIIPQGILESCIKITNEPPTGMQANLHKALENFNQETLEMSSKEAEFKAILFSLCYFHAVVAERRKFGAQGWNKIYPFNVGDLNISVSVLFNYLEANNKVPWEDLRYLFGEIMYGGHITDDWDRKLCISYLEELMQSDLVDGDLHLAPGFPAPPNTDYQGYHNYIDEVLPAENPVLYGLHPNAEIGFMSTTSENLFRTVFEMQPREAGAIGGTNVTREDKVKQIVDETLEKLPEEFNITEMMGKVEERTPYVIVAFQECQRMNFLTSEMKRSLKELELGLKGELTITSDMEDLENALFLDQIPLVWTNRAYPSLLGLGAWFSDLLLRIRELETWTTDFVVPTSVWLSGFFNPQSFLTAIMQSTARKHELPLDKMCLQCDVTKKHKEEFSGAARDGAYIHGLFMEGARWDIMQGVIMESKLKELFPQMPVINVRPYDKNFRSLSVLEPSYSPVNAGNYKSYEDSNRRNGFNLSDEDYDLSKPIDHIDGPTSPDENCSQQQWCDENDGPDFFNSNHTLSQFKTPQSSQPTCVEPHAPLRKVKRRLF